MAWSLGRIGSTVRDSVAGTLRGTGQITNVAVDVVRDSTVNGLRGARSVGGEVGQPQDCISRYAVGM